MTLTAKQLEALPVGSRVTIGQYTYEKTHPPGPNGPWRRPAEGIDAGKWVTTRSSTLVLMGVVICDG